MIPGFGHTIRSKEATTTVGPATQMHPKLGFVWGLLELGIMPRSMWVIA